MEDPASFQRKPTRITNMNDTLGTSVNQSSIEEGTTSPRFNQDDSGIRNISRSITMLNKQFGKKSKNVDLDNSMNSEKYGSEDEDEDKKVRQISDLLWGFNKA